MSSEANEWGFWTEEKLRALENYLGAFTVASQSAPNTVYLDLFAGKVDNVRKDDRTHHFLGSAARALAINPPFSHLRFFELEEEAGSLKRDLISKYGEEERHRYKVIAGDCNQTVHSVITELKKLGLDKSPSFAFLDPRAFHIDWQTVESLANFKDYKYKVEMFILFADPSIQRQYGAGADSSITKQYGNNDWKEIAKLRESDIISAEESRYFYSELFRHQLEDSLRYQTTMALPVKSDANTPVYTLVFATDNEAGKNIMSWVLTDAAESMFEERARIAIKKLKEKRRNSDNLTMRFDNENLDDDNIDDYEVQLWMRQFSQSQSSLNLNPAKSLDELIEEFKIENNGFKYQSQLEF